MQFSRVQKSSEVCRRLSWTLRTSCLQCSDKKIGSWACVVPKKGKGGLGGRLEGWCSSAATPVCWRRLVYWGPAPEADAFCLVLQCRLADGMWKAARILRKRKWRREGWCKWIVKKKERKKERGVKNDERLSEKRDGMTVGKWRRRDGGNVYKYGLSLPRPLLAVYWQSQDRCLDSLGGDSRTNLVWFVDTRHVSWSLCSVVF